MSRFLNKDDINAQLINACIVPPNDLESLIDRGFVKHQADDDTGNKTSVSLLIFEWPLATGGSLFSGGYQNFKIHDKFQNFSIKRGLEISKEDRAENRKQQREHQKRAAVQQKQKANESALRSSVEFRESDPETVGDYLKEKMIDQPYGTRCGEKGKTLIPMYDFDWKIWGNQTAFSASQEPDLIKRLGRNKTFHAGVQKRGKFFATGRIPVSGMVVVGEGSSTMLTIKMAMPELCCIVAFDAGNLPVVVAELHKRYPRLKILVCADNDFMCRCQGCKKQTRVEDDKGELVPCAHCGEAHGKVNVGKNAAIKAVNAAGGQGAMVSPSFESYDKKKSDFNDIITVEKLPIMIVSKQIQAAIAHNFPNLGEKVLPLARDAQQQGGGEDEAPFISLDEGVDRFVIIRNVKDTVYDRVRCELLARACALDYINNEHAWREWKGRPDRKNAFIEEVGFDPSESDTDIKCNIWAGWPEIKGNAGSCEMLLDLLAYLCSGEKNSREVYQWVLRWLAFPLQTPGAKMKTSLVFLGPTRVGKNLFFDVVVKMYGRYGFMIGQDALEDTFNDWLSGKLFLLANEVMARQDLFHNRNKIKTIITEDTVRIRAPFMGSRWEKNCVNLVFLSNDDQPVAPDADDERFLVVRTPKRREKEYYRKVVDEINNGGVKALYEYLKGIDLGDFDIGTHPPMTTSKGALVDLTKDSVQRFFEAWGNEEIELPWSDCLKGDLYIAYQRWCSINGEKYPRSEIQFKTAISKLDGITSTAKTVYAGLELGLAKHAPDKARKGKAVRLYEVDMPERVQWQDVIRERTRCVVNFSKALNGEDMMKNDRDDW